MIAECVNCCENVEVRVDQWCQLCYDRATAPYIGISYEEFKASITSLQAEHSTLIAARNKAHDALTEFLYSSGKPSNARRAKRARLESTADNYDRSAYTVLQSIWGLRAEHGHYADLLDEERNSRPN